MDKLLAGLDRFLETVHSEERELFETLAKGQSPETFFITCSDSRVVPSMITQTGFGELFVLRNAGNIVPPYTTAHGGESATIEYAVAALGVRDLVICGHSDCGAMKGLITEGATAEMPAVSQWLEYADRTRRIVKDVYSDLPDSERLDRAIETNVLSQLDSLKTHPTVASAVERGALHLHGWVFDIKSGAVRAWDSATRSFKPLGAAERAAAAE